MTFPFELQVAIQRRPHMRDANLEYLLHVGQHVLRQVFDEERVDPTLTKVELFYPERWMNIVEERSLFQRLARFCPNLKKVRIITQSVYIIQCTPKSCCFIVKSEDEQQREEQERGLTQESETGRLWYENAFVQDFSKLQVL
jgi:hypothetical protein